MGSLTDAAFFDVLDPNATSGIGVGFTPVGSDGTFVFDPGDDFQDLRLGETRTVAFTYQVEDGDGGADTADAFITVTGENERPVAEDVIYSGVAEDGAVQEFRFKATDHETSPGFPGPAGPPAVVDTDLLLDQATML